MKLFKICSHIEGLVQSLEEETRSNTYIVKDSMPKEIEMKRKTVQELQKIVSEPAMGQSDLEAINQKVSCNQLKLFYQG